MPNYVQSEGNAKFRVNFKPTEPSTHILSVKFNGEAVPGTFIKLFSNFYLFYYLEICFNVLGSPYLVKVVDSNHSFISGNSLRMASLSKGVEFTVENKNDEAKECKVIVTSKFTSYNLILF